MLHGDSLGGGDFGLADLTDCSLWLLGRLSALRMERLLRCNVYGGPICGATFIEGAIRFVTLVTPAKPRHLMFWRFADVFMPM